VTMSRLQLAIEQINFARNSTLGLLAQTPADVTDAARRLRERLLAGGPSGRLAEAEDRLALWLGHRLDHPDPQQKPKFPVGPTSAREPAAMGNRSRDERRR
jgi:hypothetical protein